MHTNVCSEWVLGLVIDHAWISKRAVVLVAYLGELIWLSKKFLHYTKNIVMFLSFSRNKFTPLKQNSVTDVSVGFRPPCWCHRLVPIWMDMASRYKSL